MMRPSRLVPLLVFAAMLIVAAPGYGSLTAPTGTTTTTGDPVPAFSWTAVGGATSYDFEIDSGNSIGTALNPFIGYDKAAELVKK